MVRGDAVLNAIKLEELHKPVAFVQQRAHVVDVAGQAYRCVAAREPIAQLTPVTLHDGLLIDIELLDEIRADLSVEMCRAARAGAAAAAGSSVAILPFHFGFSRSLT